MGPPPAQQCTNVSISDDTLLEDEFETVPLTLSSADSDVTFTAGGNSATISIQDDESESLSHECMRNEIGSIHPSCIIHLHVILKFCKQET